MLLPLTHTLTQKLPNTITLLHHPPLPLPRLSNFKILFLKSLLCRLGISLMYTYKASIPAATTPKAPMTLNAFIDDAALDVAVAAPEEVAVPVVLDFVAVEVPLALAVPEEEETPAQSSVATVRVSAGVLLVWCLVGKEGFKNEWWRVYNY